MTRTLEIIDPDGERRQSFQRRVIFLSFIVSVCLFGYPLAKEFRPKWAALKSARKLATFLSNLRTQAIIEKKVLEATFRAPQTIEVYEVSSCGPYAKRTKISEANLGQFEEGVEFPPETWVRSEAGSKEPYLQRYCYDPAFGSSVFADGLAHGGIFLVHRNSIATKSPESLVQLLVESASGDISIE